MLLGAREKFPDEEREGRKRREEKTIWAIKKYIIPSSPEGSWLGRPWQRRGGVPIWRFLGQPYEGEKSRVVGAH